MPQAKESINLWVGGRRDLIRGPMVEGDGGVVP